MKPWTPWPPPCDRFLPSAPVAGGTCSVTYKSVQGRGVIQELLGQIPRANGSHASGTYWPEEVLLHEHGGQSHSLQTVGCEAVRDEPVHQGGACIRSRAIPIRLQAIDQPGGAWL